MTPASKLDSSDNRLLSGKETTLFAVLRCQKCNKFRATETLTWNQFQSAVRKFRREHAVCEGK